MMVRQDFSQGCDIPPMMFLNQILNDLGKVYCYLWKKRDTDNHVSMSWDDVRRLWNKNNFRTSIRKLNNEGLLSYDESQAGIDIELVSYDEIMNAS